MENMENLKLLNAEHKYMSNLVVSVVKWVKVFVHSLMIINIYYI